MKNLFFGVSAFAFGAGAFCAPALGQEPVQAAPVDQVTPSEPPAPAAEQVVITGSFIRGTPEDAALPVEVYGAEELEEQGAPTALEFAKSLTISGATFGEANFFAGAGNTGNVGYNLRGIGADKTLTLFNSRRTSENTSFIPSIALARTEILKDGAAVIYGAEATGGVVNFITREDFTGLEGRGSYKLIDGSDGDYSLGILGGYGEGDVNFLWSAEWEHRSRLDTTERDFSKPNSLINPTQVSALTDLTRYVPVGARPTVPGANANTSAFGEFGAALGGSVPDFTAASCQAVGGIIDPNAAGGEACSYNFISYYNLVEEQDIFRVYSQLNGSLSDNVDFHVDATYGKLDNPAAYGSPSFPTVSGPARAGGASLQFLVPRTNPGAQDFVNRVLANPDPRITAAQRTAVANAQGFVPVLFRPLGHRGNLALSTGDGFGSSRKIQSDFFRVSAGLDGTLGEAFGPLSEVGFDFAVTYNQDTQTTTFPEILGFRLQDALNGFGGPNCQVVDENPFQFGIQNNTVGTSVAARAALGCEYFNPFASEFASQPELGLANPNFVSGLQNSNELVRWLHDENRVNTFNDSLTVDLVFNGETPLTLPGGPVSLAAGTQWRQLQAKVDVPSPFYNGTVQCPNPDTTTGVTVPDGPDAGTDPDVIPVTQTPRQPGGSDPLFTGCGPLPETPFLFLSPVPPRDNDRQQYSLFVEAQIPVFDNLNFQAAVRREAFSGGLEETVYKFAGKWDVWGPLSIRGSYGTNYQAPAVNLVPGEVNNGVGSISRAGNSFRGNSTLTRADIVPETATVSNIGVIWQSEGFAADHDFRFIGDFFSIETEDEFALLASFNQIANLVIPAPGGAALANCSHPLAPRILFNQGACIQGVSTGNDIAVVSSEFGNGPSQTTEGIDFQIGYSMPAGPGDLTVDVTGTYLTELKSGPSIIEGRANGDPNGAIVPVVVSAGEERIGERNVDAGVGASPEWRANASVSYRLDRHNFRFGINFVSGVDDERGPVRVIGGGPNEFTDYGVEGDDWLTFDFTYLWDLSDTLRLTATIDNILDKDPPAARQEFGYDPFIADPLGRTFEVSIRKEF